jgi:23S rRNA (uracil1939-C5)-methyltransferase
VEGVRRSVADAKATIRAGSVQNVETVASPMRRALGRFRSEKPDAVILNPSAAGADRPALEAITASTARSVAYLSCEPATLTRDMAVLRKGGFKLSTVQAIDMMPQTRQVEALALLRR